MNKILVKSLVVILAIIAIGGGYLYPKASALLGGISSISNATSNCVNQGGQTICRYRSALNTATTTPCAIKSPLATSTVISTQVMVTVASSTVTTWTVAEGNSAFATTTPFLGAYSLGSGVQGTMSFFATTTKIDDANIIPPGKYLVWGRAGTVEADATLLKGYCSATFVQN